MRAFFIFPVLLSAVITGCVSPVAINPVYPVQRIRRVAVLPIEDAPRAPGTGRTVAGLLEKGLLQSGYQMVERAGIDRILAEQGFAQTGAIASREIKEIGRILGVDAVVLGSVTHFVPPKRRMGYDTFRRTNFDPVYYDVIVQDPDGKSHQERRLAGYSRMDTHERLPHVVFIAGELAFTARMVSVETGEIIWSGSIEKSGDSPYDAAEAAVKSLMKALKPIWPSRLKQEVGR